MTTPAPRQAASTHASPPPGLPTAGFWRRYAAYAVDSLVFALPVAWVLAPLDAWLDAAGSRWVAGAATPAAAAATAARFELASLVVGALAAQAVMALPAALCLASRWQATPGKALFALRVVGPDLGRPTFARALARELGKVPAGALFGLGVLAIAWRPGHRAWYDGWVGTCVVKRWPFETYRASRSLAP